MNPLDGVLSEAWQMYKAHAWHLLAIAFVIYVGAAVLASVLGLIGVIGALLSAIVELFAAFLLQAALVKAVQDVRDGRADLSIGETVSAATPSLWSVAAASILAGVAISIGLFLVIVPGLWLITIWAVIIPVIVIERSGALDSFGRSRRLVRGHGWHVFGTLVLVFVIMIVTDIVLGLIFLALPLVWRSGLSTIISGTLVAPFLALVVTLIYYRLAAAEAGVPESAFATGPGTTPGAGPNAWPGTAPDTTPGAGPTTWPDAPSDTGPDTVQDTGPDTAPDAGPSTLPGTGADTAPDAGPSILPGTGPDAGPGTGPGGG